MAHIKRIDEMAVDAGKSKKVTNAEFSKFVKDLIEKMQKYGVAIINNTFGSRMDDYDFYEKIKHLPVWKHGEGMYPKLMTEKGYWSTTYYAFAKPCKEFARLQKMLSSKNITLNDDDVKVVYIDGKRGCYDYNGFQFLCHNPKRCNDIMDWLKSNKWRGYKVEMKVKRMMDDGERYDYDGEDMECEWGGAITYSLYLKLLTPTNRVSASMDFYV